MVSKTLNNESELFSQLAEGSEPAFVQIYWHFAKRLFPYILKMVNDEEVCKEIVQEVFVQLWEKRSALSDVKYPTSYLFNIASKRTLTYLRRKGNHARILENYAMSNTELSNETEDILNLKESTEIINEAILTLPEQRRLIFEMSRNQGMTNEQIAQTLNLSRQTVKNQLVHALKHIRTFMETRQGLFSYAVFFLLTRK